LADAITAHGMKSAAPVAIEVTDDAGAPVLELAVLRKPRDDDRSPCD
jgi:hypothetical protein